MPMPGLAAISRISCGGWRICDPSSVQSSAIIAGAGLGVGLVPERDVSIRQLLCRLGPGLGETNCFAHLGCLL